MNDHDETGDGYELYQEPIPEPVNDPVRSEWVTGGVEATSVFCAQCGYNLTGVTIGAKCPECGHTVAPSFHAESLPASGKSVAALVLGICSVVGCMFYGIPALICGPLAIIFAILANKQVKRDEAGPSSKGMALAGLICGIIGTCLALLFFGFIVVMYVVNSP